MSSREHGMGRGGEPNQSIMSGQNAMPVMMSEVSHEVVFLVIYLDCLWIQSLFILTVNEDKLARPDNDDMVVPKIAPIIGPSFPLSSLFRMVEIPGGRVR